MIQVEYFNDGMLKSAVSVYRKFIENNQNIKIISVNTLQDNSIVLTYQTA